MLWSQRKAERLRVEVLEDRAVPAVLFVDDDRAQVPTAAFTSIQAAVTAAKAGDTISVAEGTYREQVTVPANKDRLSLVARRAGTAVIQAPAVANGNSIVYIDGADDVTVRGFAIKGPSVTANAIAIGVTVDGGSASLIGNTITDIRNNPSDGAQTGFGIFVNGADARASVDIVGNVLSGYQKSGIVVDGKLATADIESNTLDGGGATAAIARNGIVVADGANAGVENNVVKGHSYTGTEAVAAVGILVDGARGVEIDGNRVSGNDVGVYANNSKQVEITGNLVWGNRIDGIDVVAVTNGAVSGNLVWGNGADGVVFSGSKKLSVTGNIVTGNGGDGLVLTDGSSGNTVRGNILFGNGGFDAFDDTTGTGTAGTANQWKHNWIVGTRTPNGLR